MPAALVSYTLLPVCLSRFEQKTLLLQASPLNPSTDVPRNQEGNKPSHNHTHADTNGELLVVSFALVAGSFLDHGFVLGTDHGEWFAQVPCGAVVGVEGLRVVETEDVALHGVASDSC